MPELANNDKKNKKKQTNTMLGKKLHRFIFAIVLSELDLLRQFLAHIYTNKFSIIFVFRILYIFRGGDQLKF